MKLEIEIDEEDYRGLTEVNFERPFVTGSVRYRIMKAYEAQMPSALDKCVEEIFDIKPQDSTFAYNGLVEKTIRKHWPKANQQPRR